MSVTIAQSGGLRITAQVVQGAGTEDSEISRAAVKLSSPTSKYFKKTPVKALSTVLILIGILQLCIAILFHCAESTPISLTLRSGVYIWGGVVMIIAGIASLIAHKLDTVKMVRICFGCNIANISVASVGLLLYAIQIYTETQICWKRFERDEMDLSSCESGNTKPYYNYYYYSNTQDVVKFRLAVTVLILLYSLVGLAISCFMTVKSNKILKTTGYSRMDLNQQ
ncbi:high affinity immunoglobulin epsilon receptor subunit beta-like [Hyperolius riggenbachi]|uniref:high affinity immunoglobulin epsilon receptor subunit beta-like n=1 Tax=Hyperolius riggenbachi TaxID=752182 RepID=UPI0035A2BC57